MRPVVKFLNQEIIQQIIAEATTILSTLGVELPNPNVINLLRDADVKIDSNSQRIFFSRAIIEQALKTVPSQFKLFDVFGMETNHFSGDKIHFTPGSSALNILDSQTQQIRHPITKDYIEYVKIVEQLPHIASQSTCMVPSDVPESIADSYRLFLSLLYGSKPVVTGAFSLEGFEVLFDLQLAVRGTAEHLAAKPLTVFSCCPTSPLKWSRTTSQNVIDCAKYNIPVEFISMPLTGFISPVTLVGTLVQHTAETLSGIVFSQLANPGAPILYGGSPSAFDLRFETTPMGAVETMMIDCAYSEIGKFLNIPTQAYISLSDAKQLDVQCGLETGMGATLAALAGINNISGPGMMDFENCISLEKLVVDNEAAGMALRLVQGIKPKEDFPALPIFQELLRDDHLIISDHTQKYWKSEHYLPGPVIDRTNQARWQEEGSISLLDRARDEVQHLLQKYESVPLADSQKQDLINVMESAAAKHQLDSLPDRMV